MDVLVIGVVGVDAELRAGCTKVAFFEEVDRPLVVDYDPHSDVDQEWSLNVFLQDEAVVLELLLRRLVYILNFLVSRGLLLHD
jgi:hypothetical protein